MVSRQRGEERDDRERIHADPLVPAQLAGNEPGRLREVEAAPGGDRGDDEDEPELVAPHRRARLSERTAYTCEREDSYGEEKHDDDLTDDAERGERDDDPVGAHAGIPAASVTRRTIFRAGLSPDRGGRGPCALPTPSR